MAKTNLCDELSTLNLETLRLVQSEARGVLAVNAKTGVPISWLRKYAAGKIKSPSVNRVQFIHEKLSGIKLKTK